MSEHMWRDERYRGGSEWAHDPGRREFGGGEGRGRFGEQRSWDDERRWAREQSATGGGVFGTPDYEGGRRRGRGEESRRGYGAREWGRGEPPFGDEDRALPRNETERLIASNKVEGTSVFSRRGERLGRIENFMVGKRSGKVEYAVMSFGGFMGMGERHYPVPWDQLNYEERLGGYVVDIDQRDLERAPSHHAADEPRYEGAYGSDIRSYYGY